jgi:hypothetical protein
MYANCGAFHDGSEKGAARVHQILCESSEVLRKPLVIQQAIGDQSLRRAQVFQWHARFKTGVYQ